MPKLRCENKTHGIVSDNSIGEIRMMCRDRMCKIRNEVVEHVWNLEKISEDGNLYPVETNRFKRP